MAYKNCTVLAVVPARGGSKSIPRKNLCKIGGVSLVARAASISGEVGWIDRKIVSTDDEEIAQEAVAHGLEAPFMRPPELADDYATSIDMWRHAWLAAEEHYAMDFDVSILLEPTSPLRRVEDIERTMAALFEGEHLAAATISCAPAHFTPHKCLTLDDRGDIGFYLEQDADYSIRQKIPRYYFRNGICYAVKRSTLVDNRFILQEQCKGVLVHRPVVNIDEPYELELAEFLLNREASQ